MYFHNFAVNMSFFVYMYVIQKSMKLWISLLKPSEIIG